MAAVELFGFLLVGFLALAYGTAFTALVHFMATRNLL